MAKKKKEAVPQDKNVVATVVATMIEMGKFYFLNGKYPQAIAEFKKALEIEPNSAEIYYNLGLIYETQNKLNEAHQMYEQALSINPKYSLAKQHLNKLIGIDK